MAAVRANQATTPPPVAAGSIEHEVGTAIDLVRAGLAAICDGLPGASRPVELSRVLSIDKMLAWKIMRSLDATDPFAAATLLPGIPGLQIFFDAAARYGVEASKISQARDAAAELNELMRRHAGNRKTFHRIISSMSRQSRDEAGLTHRRAAFEANSYLFGVKAKAQLALHLVNVADDGIHVDIAAVAMFVDLVRIRPDAAWVITRTAFARDGDAPKPTIEREPMLASENRSTTTAAPPTILEPFSSSPLPALDTEIAPDGFLETILPAGTVGDTGAITITTGEVYRRIAPRYTKNPGETADFIVHLRTPAEHFVNVVLVRRGLFADASPDYFLCSELGSNIRHRGDVRPHLILPGSPRIDLLGRADRPLLWSREVPRLDELIAYICDRLDWPANAFDAYQFRLPYPILRTAAMASFRQQVDPEQPPSA